MSEAFRNHSESVRGRAGPAASPWTPGPLDGAARVPGGPPPTPGVQHHDPAAAVSVAGRLSGSLPLTWRESGDQTRPPAEAEASCLLPPSIKPWASGSAFPTLPYFFTAPCFLTMRLHWRMPAPRPASTFAILHCAPPDAKWPAHSSPKAPRAPAAPDFKIQVGERGFLFLKAEHSEGNLT